MQSPTSRLVAGLAFTLLVISAYAFYSLRSVWRLRDTQTRIVDRNRQASTQLLRIQGELNTLGLTVREMLDEKPDYPLEAWQAPLRRVRENLDDALRREAELSAGMRAPQCVVRLNFPLACARRSNRNIWRRLWPSSGARRRKPWRRPGPETAQGP
jgi:hypothetical protein